MLQSKSGLPPYDDMLLFAWRIFTRRGPKSRAAVVAGDIDSICQRPEICMLAHGFNKSNRQVARELIELDRSLEHGQAAGEQSD